MENIRPHDLIDICSLYFDFRRREQLRGVYRCEDMCALWFRLTITISKIMIISSHKSGAIRLGIVDVPLCNLRMTVDIIFV